MECNSLAVMQPYFFPYIGYFSLIDSVDHFMFFDNVQYNRKSWMGRNRILNIENQEVFYIRPGIKKPKYQEQLSNVTLDIDSGWEHKILDQLNTYKRKGAFYKEVKNVLEDIFNENYAHLVEFNIKSTLFLSKKLELSTTFENYTDYNYTFDEEPSAETWALEISKKRRAKSYINAPGGEAFIHPAGFTKSNIKLGFIQPNIIEYKQKIDGFFPGLSIIDVLIFNGFEKTHDMIKDYFVKWKN